MLKHLLRNNPPFSDSLGEQVLREYMRIHRGAVDALCQMGCDREDVEQELRIHLWMQWKRYQPGSITLQQWLSWRMRHKVRSMLRNEQKRSRIRTCPLDIEDPQ